MRNHVGQISDPIARLTGRTAEARLRSFILDECLDDEVLDYLLPGQRPHAWEGSLWDYKRDLPSTSGREPDVERAENLLAVAELVKDVVSMHNSYGGYIVAGVNEHTDLSLVGCQNLCSTGFTVEKLNQQVASYTRTNISCRFRQFQISNVPLGLLLVPMRDCHAPAVRMARGAPIKSNGRSSFSKGDIYARIGDSCVPVHRDMQALQFVCSERIFGKDREFNRQLENNLPPRDPNLIQFVGRTDYLVSLWNWLTDRHTPVKVITALGGTGKTATAFEFCRQIVNNCPAQIQKVIWLTAKKQSFSAIRGQWVGVTRTDFGSPNEFLSALARELGASDEEAGPDTDRPELLDSVLEGLRYFPSLVVVDDVDSLPIEQQSDLFSLVQNVAGRSFERGNRFILTSRLELSAGEDQLIRLRGFEEKEFSEYAKIIAGERQIRLDDGAISRLYRASLGSPMFCSSIIRLVSLGADINAAINQWRNQAGEAVRKFAFERELDQLTDSQARTLFTLSLLGETTQLELKQVLNADDDRIILDLARLREYHLFASRGDPVTGTKLEAPEPIRLMNDVLKARVLDPVRIERECARVRSQVPRVQDRVAIAIAGVLALWKADEYQAALMNAQQAQKANPKSGDLWCMLGQCYLKVQPPKPEEADKAFRQAHIRGCSRPELLPNWLEAKRLGRDWNGIIDLGKMFPASEVRGGSVVIVLDAMMEIGKQFLNRNDLVRGCGQMREVMFAASRSIAQSRADDQIVSIRTRCRAAAQDHVRLADTVNDRPGDRLNVFNSVMDAFLCHVTETWIVDLGLDSLRRWALDAVARPVRDFAALDILAMRLRDLEELRTHIEQAGPGRLDLLARIENTLRELRRLLLSQG